ncbi:hypothetical protein U9M48_002298 [Paspalum notatum var. saurae]|uniref:Uncharacterized protein n=1 Tax=Paspalum notatum var. saurae TaxID=547442 RepID=A0AAQ3SHC7_PASNO
MESRPLPASLHTTCRHRRRQHKQYSTTSEERQWLLRPCAAKRSWPRAVRRRSLARRTRPLSPPAGVHLSARCLHATPQLPSTASPGPPASRVSYLQPPPPLCPRPRAARAELSRDESHARPPLRATAPHPLPLTRRVHAVHVLFLAQPSPALLGMSTSSSRSHAPTTPVRAPLPRSPPRLQYLAPTSGVGSALIPHTLALAALLPTGAPRRRPHTRTAAPWAISVCRPAAPASTTRSAAVVAAFLHRRPTFFIQIIVFTGRHRDSPSPLPPRRRGLVPGLLFESYEYMTGMEELSADRYYLAINAMALLARLAEQPVGAQAVLA